MTDNVEPEVSIRLKVKDNEFEVKGKEKQVNELIEKRFLDILKAFESAIITIKPSISEAEEEPKEDKAKQKKKPDKRGGQRPSFISPAIGKLIDEGWFKQQHRKVDEIVIKLQNSGTPGVTNQNVTASCMRRVRDLNLKTTKDAGVRIFWSE